MYLIFVTLIMVMPVKRLLSSLRIQVPKVQHFTYPEHKWCGKFGVCIADGKEFCNSFKDNLSCFHTKCHTIYIKLHCFAMRSGLCGRNLGIFCFLPQKIPQKPCLSSSPLPPHGKSCSLYMVYRLKEIQSVEQFFMITVTFVLLTDLSSVK